MPAPIPNAHVRTVGELIAALSLYPPGMLVDTDLGDVGRVTVKCICTGPFHDTTDPFYEKDEGRAIGWRRVCAISGREEDEENDDAP